MTTQQRNVTLSDTTLDLSPTPSMAAAGTIDASNITLNPTC